MSRDSDHFGDFQAHMLEATVIVSTSPLTITSCIFNAPLFLGEDLALTAHQLCNQSVKDLVPLPRCKRRNREPLNIDQNFLRLIDIIWRLNRLL